VKPGCAVTQNVTLSPIHYRAVQRIYGEHGQQMVKLVRENPAYAIPIVFKRLEQKDREWCAATHLVGLQSQPMASPVK
jgi:histone deacetylase complex regulatory component SIN3